MLDSYSGQRLPGSDSRALSTSAGQLSTGLVVSLTVTLANGCLHLILELSRPLLVNRCLDQLRPRQNYSGQLLPASDYQALSTCAGQPLSGSVALWSCTGQRLPTSTFLALSTCPGQLLPMLFRHVLANGYLHLYFKLFKFLIFE